MKKTSLLLFLLILTVLPLRAVTSTYTFLSPSWRSQIGATVTDGKGDGWHSDGDATDYNAGRTDAAGRLYSCGVGVKTGTSGAGATSVIAFQGVRRVIINYCQNASKGRGTLRVSVGGQQQTLDVQRPAESGQGVYNRDAEFVFDSADGQVSFAVDCTENGIYINTITIKASTGSPLEPAVSGTAMRLVTDAAELQEGDEVMIGVARDGYDYVMGLWDDSFSRNNIAAQRARYDAHRQTVSAGDECLYTVECHDGAYAFVDACGWYLTASGGNPNRGNNNYLTVWDDYASTSYGDYGLWDVTIGADGSAAIVSRGTSRSNRLQFNPGSASVRPLFACYADATQTPVCLYRRQQAPADGQPLLRADRVSFGTVLLTADAVAGSRAVEVQGLNLTDDIRATLASGAGATPFSLDRTLLDRDGDVLTVSYRATATGTYADTLLLQSGDVVSAVPLLLTVDRARTIAEARQLPDLTTCWLADVTVTKKYDRYLFVADATGALLLYDGGNQYAQGVRSGDILSDVSGYAKAYYGNPEVTLTAPFTVTAGTVPSPALVERLDSADVCRYVRLQDVTLDAVPLYDLFHYIGDNRYPADERYDLEGIVYYYHQPVLCPTLIQTATGVHPISLPEEGTSEDGLPSLWEGTGVGSFDLQGRAVAAPLRGIRIHNGRKQLVR